jgi:hypothetical protein
MANITLKNNAYSDFNPSMRLLFTPNAARRNIYGINIKGQAELQGNFNGEFSIGGRAVAETPPILGFSAEAALGIRFHLQTPQFLK